MPETGLTTSQIATVRRCEVHIADHGALPATSTAWGEMLGLSRQGATKHLQPLVEKGYLAPSEGGGWTLLKNHRGEPVRVVAAPVTVGGLTLTYATVEGE